MGGNIEFPTKIVTLDYMVDTARSFVSNAGKTVADSLKSLGSTGLVSNMPGGATGAPLSEEHN
ncbi:unnamed protein product [Rhizopus stolonifer]